MHYECKKRLLPFGVGEQVAPWKMCCAISISSVFERFFLLLRTTEETLQATVELCFCAEMTKRIFKLVRGRFLEVSFVERTVAFVAGIGIRGQVPRVMST